MAKKKSTWLLCFSKLGSWLGFRRASIPPNLVGWVYLHKNMHNSFYTVPSECPSIAFECRHDKISIHIQYSSWKLVSNTEFVVPFMDRIWVPECWLQRVYLCLSHGLTFLCLYFKPDNRHMLLFFVQQRMFE